MRAIIRCLLVVILLAGAALPAAAGRRVALLFAAARYVALRPLSNPRRDAGALREVLERLGFEVALEAARCCARMMRVPFAATRSARTPAP